MAFKPDYSYDAKRLQRKNPKYDVRAEQRNPSKYPLTNGVRYVSAYGIANGTDLRLTRIPAPRNQPAR